MVEHTSHNRTVEGSNPFFAKILSFGPLLVQWKSDVSATLEHPENREGVAQLAEHRAFNSIVRGSSPLFLKKA